MADTRIFPQPSREKHLNVTLQFLKMTREGVFAHIDETVIAEERQEYLVYDCQDEYYYSLS